MKGDTLMAVKPRVWIAKLGAAAGNGAWDLAPDGKRVAAVTPVESAEAPKQEHEVVFLQNFSTRCGGACRWANVSPRIPSQRAGLPGVDPGWGGDRCSLRPQDSHAL